MDEATTGESADAVAPVAAAAPAPGVPAIVLASNCAVKDAAQLKQSLCEHVAHDAAVRLDARAVERIDTATLQLLCAFVRDRAAASRPVEWLGVSQPLTDAARLLGIVELLALAPTLQTNGEAAA